MLYFIRDVVVSNQAATVSQIRVFEKPLNTVYDVVHQVTYNNKNTFTYD